MRLAHLILVHDNPLHVERLVKRLAHANADIYIHLDKKCDINEFASLQSLENVFFIEHRTAITWATYSMITATINCFEAILNTGKNYSHINLLSGQDYPLKDAATIQRFLFANADKTFMAYRHIPSEWPDPLSRFTMYSFGDYKFPLRFKIQQLFNSFLPGKKLPMGLDPYGRSQWFTITPACAKYAIDYIREHASIRRFFRMTWSADELIFQTVLINSPLKDSVVNDHLRFIKFLKGSSSPVTLTVKDADSLINSGKFYARKFNSATDSEILNLLDKNAQLETSLLICVK
jgi:hypothetical protein